MKCLLAAFVSLVLSPPLQAADSPALALQNTVALPGVGGRFDHAAFDAETSHLFFAALGNDTLEVIDIAAGKRLHTITGLKEPTGVAFLPDQKVLVVANGGDGTCRFFDATSYAEKGRITGLDDADNVRFDAKANRIYLGYGGGALGFGGGALGVIDPVAMKLTASIPLSKHPESFQLERDGTRIFVNIPGARQIAVVDRQKLQTVATWPLDRWHSNFPMNLDDEHGLIFVGFRNPARLVAFSAASGSVSGECEIGGDVDDLFFDARHRRIYASCGEGFLDTIEVGLTGQLTRVEHQPTRSGARTCFFSPVARQLFLAVPGKAELRIYKPGQN